MDTATSRSTAIDLMNQWGLIEKGWRFVFDNRRSALGRCSYSKKIIYLSRHHVTHDTDSNVIDTIKHEIAHALHYLSYAENGREGEFGLRHWTGRKWVRKIKPHGREWQMWAVKVGANPNASTRSNVSAKTATKWRLVCVQGLNVEDIRGYQRMPKRVSASAWIPSRKRATYGNLYMVYSDNLKRVKANPSHRLDLFRSGYQMPVKTLVDAKVV